MSNEDPTLKIILSAMKDDLKEFKADLRDIRSDLNDKWETTLQHSVAQKEVIKQLNNRVSDIQALLIKGHNGEKPIIYTVASLREDSTKFKTYLDEVDKTAKMTKKELDDMRIGSNITPPAVRAEQWKIVGGVLTLIIGFALTALAAYFGLSS